MCGICGIYSLNSQIDRGQLEKMRDELSHRGPDNKGVYISENIGLGHCRLSIIDKSTLAHQPLSNEDGAVWVVLNGEIYNYLSLREDLKNKGHIFRSNSDTEVLVHLYEEFGEGFIEKLRGMFAFALWDENRKRLILARDRVGQKPLVYAEKDNALYFASEIKSLRSISGIGRKIDNNSILLYFSFKLPIGEQTMYTDIKRLPPGTYMLVENGEIELKTYWTPDRFRKVEIDSRQPEKQLFSLLDETVESQMLSDVPVGAFLSGGIDSSVIVGLMSAYSRSPVKTFSIGYENDDIKDPDWDFAEEAAKKFKTEHKKIKFDPAWIYALNEVVLSMDEPYSNPDALSFYFLCKEIKKDVTVALSGDGSDEVFAGYSGYRNWKIIDWVSCRLGISGKLDINSDVIKKKILSDSNISEITKMGLILSVSNAQKRGLRRMFDSREITSKLFTDKIKDDIEYGLENKILEKAFHEFNRKDFIDNVQLTDLLLHNSHGITWMSDQIGMAHSLEIRAPFLDHHLIEFAFSLPSSMRIKGINGRKYILKKALNGFLPKPILNRKKVGYGEGIPYKKFFKNEWNGYVKKKLFNGVLEEWGGIDMGYLHTLYEENLSSNRDHFETLWAVLVLSVWMERVYKRSF